MEDIMQNTLSEKIRIAAQELRLTDTQRNIVAHRLTRALLKIDAEAVSVEELRQLITDSLVGVPGAVTAHRKPPANHPRTRRRPGTAAGRGRQTSGAGDYRGGRGGLPGQPRGEAHQ